MALKLWPGTHPTPDMYTEQEPMGSQTKQQVTKDNQKPQAPPPESPGKSKFLLPLSTQLFSQAGLTAKVEKTEVWDKGSWPWSSVCPSSSHPEETRKGFLITKDLKKPRAPTG